MLEKANIIILIILIIVLLLNTSLIKNLFKNEEAVLDDVKLREESSNKGFALMLEQEDGTYKESSSSSWPTGMKFNSELSGCIDIDGNKIENALSFNTSTNAIKLRTNGSIYCYVYFDLDSSITNYLINNVTNGDLWKSTLEEDGYRYVGTNPNNYICFGTSDMNACVTNNDKYMYRIIGIFADDNGNNHLKLIKKESLNVTYAWNSDYSTDIDWDKSDLYRGLNGSYFSANTSYSYMQDVIWKNKIANWNYTATITHTQDGKGGPDYYSGLTVKQLYLHELNRNGKSSNVGTWTSFAGNISLMYASDYILSFGSSLLNYSIYTKREILKTGWMHINNNDIDPPIDNTCGGNLEEWTMTRLGGDEYDLQISWSVSSNGNMNHWYADCTYIVRPTFYLESYVELASNSGNGSITNPYLIKE